MKESAGAELVEAVREAVNGGAFFSPPLLKLLKEWRVGPADGRVTAWAATLSRREAEVLQLIAEGYASKQIGALLSLSERTVEKHRQSLMGKVGCHNIATLTIYAVAHGVVELNHTPGHTPNWPARGLRLGKCSNREAAGAM